jgi:MFS family permease
MLIIVLMNFLLAITTTIAMSILPLVTTEKIGLSIFVFGLIEGGTEFLSNIFRLVSGSLFDRIKNKKNIFILAANFAFISKILLLFHYALPILGSKIFERLANGLFASPRDAFVGQNAKNKGFALAILSCSKTLGCVAGPVIVSATVFYLGDLNSQLYNLVIFSAFITFLALILSCFIKTKSFTLKDTETKFVSSQVFDIAGKIKPLLIISILFFLGRFNDGIIMIYLKKSGLPEWFYLSTIGFFNIIMFIVSPVLGLMIDRKKSIMVLFITIVALFIFNILFYFIEYAPFLLGSLGLVAWGLQRVGAQISFSAMIFKNVPNRFYGTAIGVYSLLSGVGNILAASICGYFAGYSFEYVFLFSGTSSLACLIIAIIFVKKKYLLEQPKHSS